ncbi:hypothetical protein FYJ85_04145 [Victivallaceae bacterium BBE-744-WT-12]|uniref:Uncharacterized protein n=1 Tax=Victivallis lenta TaxID=2606640 RepID=A0A844FY99_9BACT|nr:hypothetical protein [Victivallis lenta]MBS1454412.1 hypothetical protein [Lentisphaeria bacterium]MBS5530617.1 hypothetical protein [bacterium]MST96237.1 hypothetical protein [Victivallis lenta]HBP05558.1 hypothetical protein [Lentisphaeria bacterium]HCH86936.1 hypothetical protein [Lentisphaeria bacterium]
MNRSILIVMCDFLVSAMLSMLIGMSPHGQSGHMGKGALLDRGSTAIILDELRRRGAELENMREQLREAQAREGFSEAREAQLKALAEQLAETLAKSELLEDKLKLHPENAGALTPQALQQKLEEEIRKRTLAGVQRKEAEAELERMRNSLQSVSGNLATLNTNYAVSQQQLADARKAIEEREQKLENTGGELTRTREELAAQRNELANVRSTLESELARLAEVRTRAQALESNLSFTRGRLSAAERELAEARSAAEQNRKLAARREMEVRDTQRQLADARKAMLKAVNDYSRVKSELDRSKEAISAAADARAEAERNLAAKQGEADTALARLEATKKELQAAEEKLRSDVLERYDASVIRLTFALNEKRLLLDQKGGGVFYLPLVNIAGKTVMPGFHKQLFGDAEYALNFDRVDRLEYRVNVTSAPLEEAGTQLRGPLLLFPGEPRLAAIEFNVRGRKPLAALTIDALKQRGLDDLFLFKPGTFGKESAPISDRCSLDLGSGGPQLYIRNTGRGSGSELRAEPGDFIITKQGDFVGIVTGIENFDMGRRQEAKCYVLPADFKWDGAKTIRLEKAAGAEYFEDFSKGVREIRAGQNE